MAARYAPDVRLIRGPAGQIEAAVAEPAGDPERIALVAHPHPLHGGTMGNKVAQTLCKALHSCGCLVATMNFRGVGRSEGAHDSGIGEAEDVAALAAHAKSLAGDLPVVLAGFSFGAGVQVRASARVKADLLLLVAPSVAEDLAPQAPAAALASYGDDVVAPDGMIRWCGRFGARLTLVPDAGHFFHGKLHVVSEWAREEAARRHPQ